MVSQDVEVKQGFTVKYFLLVLTTSVIAAVLGFFSSYAVERFKEERKIIEVSSVVSANLAALPAGVGKDLNINISMANGFAESVESLFKYDVTIANNSGRGIDDFVLYIRAPKGLSLANKPSISSYPDSIIDTVKVDRAESRGNGEAYKISLLNNKQSISLSYYGFSKEVVEAKPLDVVMQKKDWEQNNVSSASVDLLKPDPVFAFIEKKVAEFTGFDVLVVLLLSSCFGLFVTIYWTIIDRMYLSRFIDRFRRW